MVLVSHGVEVDRYEDKAGYAMDQVAERRTSRHQCLSVILEKLHGPLSRVLGSAVWPLSMAVAESEQHPPFFQGDSQFPSDQPQNQEVLDRATFSR